MKIYLLLLLSCITCSMSLSATQVIKQGNAWGRFGTALGQGFAQGCENSIHQQQQLELLEREREIQLELLERQRQIELEIIKLGWQVQQQ